MNSFFNRLLSTSALNQINFALSGGVLAVSLELGDDVYLLELTGSSYASYLRAIFGDAVVNDPGKEVSHWGELADFDKDGLNTLEEVFFGRDPTVSDSQGVIHRPVNVSTLQFALQWAQPSETFGVHACPEWSSDLTNWTVSGENPAGSATARTITSEKIGSLGGLDLWQAQIPRNGSPKLFLRLQLHRE